MSVDVSDESAWRESIGRKIDTLSERVEKGFAGVDEAFVEQRKYTEFAFEQLHTEMKSEISGLRGEMKSEIGGLRTQMQTEMDGLRGDMRRDFGRLDRKLDRVLDVLPAAPAAPRRRRRS